MTDIQREMETLVGNFHFRKLYDWLEAQPDDFIAFQSTVFHCPLAKYFQAQSKRNECYLIQGHALRSRSDYFDLGDCLSDFYCDFDLHDFGHEGPISKQELLSFVAPYAEEEERKCS